MAESKRKRTKKNDVADADTTKINDENNKKNDNTTTESSSTTESKGKKVTLLKHDEIKIGDILSQTQYLKVLSKEFPRPNELKLEVNILRSAKPESQGEDIWNITTPFPMQVASASHYSTTVKVTKTIMAQTFMECGTDVFTVTFRPTLNADSLMEKLRTEASNFQEAKTDAARKKIAKSLMEIEPKVLRGRMLEPNSELGYSLVDDLGYESGQAVQGTAQLGALRSSTRKIQFRQVNHRDILELITNNVRYVLK